MPPCYETASAHPALSIREAEEKDPTSTSVNDISVNNILKPLHRFPKEHCRSDVLSLASNNGVSISNGPSLQAFASLCQSSRMASAKMEGLYTPQQPYLSGLMFEKAPDSPRCPLAGPSEAASTDRDLKSWSALSIPGSFSPPSLQWLSPASWSSGKGGTDTQSHSKSEFQYTSESSFGRHYNTSLSDTDQSGQSSESSRTVEETFWEETEESQSIWSSSSRSENEDDFENHPGHACWEWDCERQRWRRRGRDPSEEDFFPDSFA